MPVTRSAKKALRRDQRRKAVNLRIKKKMKIALKKAKEKIGFSLHGLSIRGSDALMSCVDKIFIPIIFGARTLGLYAFTYHFFLMFLI